MRLLTCYAALPFFWSAAVGFAQTTSSQAIPVAHTEAPNGTEAARLELLHDTVSRALRDAELRLEDGRLDDAIAMAWAGLEQAAELPTSPSRFTLIESLMLVVVDARRDSSTCTRASTTTSMRDSIRVNRLGEVGSSAACSSPAHAMAIASSSRPSGRRSA